MLEKYFHIAERKTSVPREMKAGITTFLTLSYILFIQPALLSGKFFGTPTGMDEGAILTGTCLASAIGTLLMALYARSPIALAPGMSENFFFVGSLLPAAVGLGVGTSWETALGAVFFAALLFLVLSLTGVSTRILHAFSPSMRYALIVGIGLFITLIGLKNSGLIVNSSSSGLELTKNVVSANSLVFFAGLFLGALLHVWNVKSYVLWSIIGAFICAALFRLFAPEQITFEFPTAIVSLSPSVGPIFMKIDFVHSLSLFPLILILLVLSLFDATGTLIAVANEANLMKGDKIERAKHALICNPVAAMIGAIFGMSTISSFMESLAGVEQGGRTGLTSLTVAILFLLSLFFYPLIVMISNYPPITSAALVLVGAIMIKGVKEINWTDYTETLPAFLTLICIPFFFSIANGIGIGLVAYPLIKLLAGRFKELNPYNVILGLFFLIYFILLR